MPIKESELILDSDGSIHHLNLKLEHLLNTIITVVGDPDYVPSVTKHFDNIEFKTQKKRI